MIEDGTQHVELSPKQRRAIRALIESGDMAHAAETVGVGRNTLYRWMRLPAFREALRAAEKIAIESLGRGLVSLADDVLAVWREALTNEDVPWTVRERSANNVAGYLLRYRELITLEDRITDLEARL